MRRTLSAYQTEGARGREKALTHDQCLDFDGVGDSAQSDHTLCSQ